MLSVRDGCPTRLLETLAPQSKSCTADPPQSIATTHSETFRCRWNFSTLGKIWEGPICIDVNGKESLMERVSRVELALRGFWPRGTRVSEVHDLRKPISSQSVH